MTQKFQWPRSNRWPQDDHEALVRAAQGAKTALEFGPGHSTLGFFEARVKTIDSFEHDNYWLRLNREFLHRWKPSGCDLALRKYENIAAIVLNGCLEHYDIALVDSPKGSPELSRLNTLTFALAHADIVLLHDCDRAGEQNSIIAAECPRREKLTAKLWRVK